MLTLKSKTLSLCLSLALAVLGFSNQSNAAEDDFGSRDETRTTQRGVLPENGFNNLAPQPQQQPRISRRQAMNLASGRYEGRVLGVVQVDNNNWRVRMDRDGTVFNVFVNVSSGAVSAASD